MPQNQFRSKALKITGSFQILHQFFGDRLKGVDSVEATIIIRYCRPVKTGLALRRKLIHGIAFFGYRRTLIHLCDISPPTESDLCDQGIMK